MNLFNTILLSFVISSTVQVANAQTKVIYKENFRKNSFEKNWLRINGNWEVKDQVVEGTKNSDWAVLLCKKPLPVDYILTFSTLVDSSARLFEVITNLNGEKYLGVMYDQLEKKVAVEDRSLFADPAKRGYIYTTGNVGKLPRVHKTIERIWLNWKVQKTGNQIFVWMNDAPVLSFTDTIGLVKAKGRFGFTINGKAIVKDIKLEKTRKKSSLPPENFIGMPEILPFFLFSE